MALVVAETLSFYDCSRECNYEIGITADERVATLEVYPEKGSPVPFHSYFFDEKNAPRFASVLLRVEFFLASPYLQVQRQRKNQEAPTPPAGIQSRTVAHDRVDARITQRKPCRGA